MNPVDVILSNRTWSNVVGFAWIALLTIAFLLMAYGFGLLFRTAWKGPDRRRLIIKVLGVQPRRTVDWPNTSRGADFIVAGALIALVGFGSILLLFTQTLLSPHKVSSRSLTPRPLVARSRMKAAMDRERELAKTLDRDPKNPEAWDHAVEWIRGDAVDVNFVGTLLLCEIVTKDHGRADQAKRVLREAASQPGRWRKRACASAYREILGILKGKAIFAYDKTFSYPSVYEQTDREQQILSRKAFSSEDRDYVTSLINAGTEPQYGVAVTFLALCPELTPDDRNFAKSVLQQKRDAATGDQKEFWSFALDTLGS